MARGKSGETPVYSAAQYGTLASLGCRYDGVE